MDELKKKIEKTRQRNLVRARANYALAKKLGFNSYEAGVLAQRSDKYILRLAEERKNDTSQKTDG